MAVTIERPRTEVWAPPYALLRAGFPYIATLGMRRVTTYCVDLAFGEGVLYVLGRDDASYGNYVRLINWDDEDLGDFGKSGSGDGQMLWPVQIQRDAQGLLYISDEGLHRIAIFDSKGGWVGKWGEQGGAPGQLERPSGLALDGQGTLWVVDTGNHRIQRFTTDGKLLSGFGRQGSAPGELNHPWGVAVDPAGSVYVSDWGNDRIQKFSPDGELLLCFGRFGSGPGELRRPAGLAVDDHGDIYVADRGNHRIVLFDKTGRYVEQFIGDSSLSKSGRLYIQANPKVLRLREMACLEPQKRFRGPAAVRLDAEGRMYVPDFGSHRIQVYKKEAYPLAETEIWPEQRTPNLTV